jgi:universal stress protein A
LPDCDPVAADRLLLSSLITRSQETTMTSYQHILCATDFSPNCKVAAERALALAGVLGASLTILHVVDHFPEDRSNQLIAPEDQDPAAFRARAAQQAMQALVSALGCEDAAQQIVFSTKAAKYEIIDFIREARIDLVVVASRANLGLQHMLGSTASGLVHAASCDVLVVRPEDEKA